MKCSPIKLTSRPKTNSRTVFKCHPLINHYESFTFRWTNNNQNDRTPPTLSVTTIDLPENFKSFNTGSSCERWKKKAPRFKGSKSSRVIRREADDDDTVPEEVNVDGEESRVGIEPEEEVMDPDIQKLIMEAYGKHEEDSALEPEEEKRPRNSGNKKKKKTIRFSLSSPPTPNTEQIIRVDVTSNYSIEEEDVLDTVRTTNSSTKTDKDSRKKNVTIIPTTDDFVVKCQKLALSNRG